MTNKWPTAVTGVQSLAVDALFLPYRGGGCQLLHAVNAKLEILGVSLGQSACG